MNTFLYSIIVPVYNVEKYLNRCIDSILSQEFTNFEILLIDDGSTDSSLEICKTYENDPRVKVFTKANGGLSSARNFGLEKASGKYIVFIDSDDYIAEHSLQKISEMIQTFHSDVFCIKAMKVYDDGEHVEQHKNMPVREFSSDEYLDYLFENRTYSACAPYMIYKTEFLRKHNFSFYYGILHEDELWTPQILLKANSICSTNILMYYHCLRKGSITQSDNYERRGDSLIIVLRELLKIEGFTKNEHAKILRNKWAYIMLEAVYLLNASDKIVKAFPRNLAYTFSYTLKTKIKSLLYLISPTLYVSVRNSIK